MTTSVPRAASPITKVAQLSRIFNSCAVRASGEWKEHTTLYTKYTDYSRDTAHKGKPQCYQLTRGGVNRKGLYKPAIILDLSATICRCLESIISGHGHRSRRGLKLLQEQFFASLALYMLLISVASLFSYSWFLDLTSWDRRFLKFTRLFGYGPTIEISFEIICRPKISVGRYLSIS